MSELNDLTGPTSCRAPCRITDGDGVQVLAVCGRPISDCKHHARIRMGGERMSPAFYQAVHTKRGFTVHGRRDLPSYTKEDIQQLEQEDLADMQEEVNQAGLSGVDPYEDRDRRVSFGGAERSAGAPRAPADLTAHTPAEDPRPHHSPSSWYGLSNDQGARWILGSLQETLGQVNTGLFSLAKTFQGHSEAVDWQKAGARSQPKTMIPLDDQRWYGFTKKRRGRKISLHRSGPTKNGWRRVKTFSTEQKAKDWRDGGSSSSSSSSTSSSSLDNSGSDLGSSTTSDSNSLPALLGRRDSDDSSTSTSSVPLPKARTQKKKKKAGKKKKRHGRRHQKARPTSPSSGLISSSLEYQGRDKSTGNSTHAFGHNVDDIKFSAEVGPPGLTHKDSAALFNAAVDVTALPGMWSSDAGETEDMDAMEAVATTAATLAAASRGKSSSRTGDPLWRHRKRHALSSISSGEDLNKFVEQVDEVEVVSFKQMESLTLRFLTKRHYDKASAKAYLLTGFMPIIVRASYRYYCRLSTLIRGRMGQLRPSSSTTGRNCSR
jgi:hypothetical protein